MMEGALNPRLVGIAGPVEGGLFGLSDDVLSVGRDASNQFPIDDPSIAARHCLIRRREGEEFEIQDLGSCGTTTVNGVPVTERTLRHGDQIGLGDCHFLFLRWDGAVQLTQCPLTTMLKIGASVQVVQGAEDIAQQWLEGIFEVIPAQQGGVLLFDGQSQEPCFASYRDRETGPTTTVRAYDAIVERARHGVTGLLATAGDFSVLAAPIITSARTLGVICFDTAIPSVPFHDGHLELAISVGAILGLALENARRLEWLETENVCLREASDIEHDMVGVSPRMREVYQFVSKVAPSDSTVLIRGESGTGKELVARAIHRNSPRAGMPFLAINCAALTETLLESELFGHEKGAFTGAYAQKRGKLELADRGTVFLDEVGEMPPACQARLLRLIQEREFERVGGTRRIRTDIRLIAATNRDLEAALERGAFRKDLYYRLNVVSLTMPPLRERREDIPLLASHFVAKHGKRARRRVAGIAREALECMKAHDWPGNVRDLENAIERAVVLGSTDLILAEDLPETVVEAAPQGASGPTGGYHETIRNEKARVILAALDQAEGSFTEAAKLLGIHANYLHRLVRNLGLRGAIKGGAGG